MGEILKHITPGEFLVVSIITAVLFGISALFIVTARDRLWIGEKPELTVADFIQKFKRGYRHFDISWEGLSVLIQFTGSKVLLAIPNSYLYANTKEKSLEGYSILGLNAAEFWEYFKTIPSRAKAKDSSTMSRIREWASVFVSAGELVVIADTVENARKFLDSNELILIT